MKIYWRDTTLGIEEIVAVREGNLSTYWSVDNDTLLLGTLPHSNTAGTDGTIP
jgi:hypothetical protein